VGIIFNVLNDKPVKIRATIFEGGLEKELFGWQMLAAMNENLLMLLKEVRLHYY
jgi:hypothetical protein